MSCTWLIVIGLAGCVAPPMGIGRGALTGSQPVNVSFGGGELDKRQVMQVEGSYTFPRGHFLGVGVLPYWRPRWQLGHVSFAVAVSGALFGAGEGGMIAGFADGQVGYGTRNWSIYAGGYGHVCAVADGGPIVFAAQARVGGE